MNLSNSRNSRDLGPLIKGVEHIAIATTQPQLLAQWYVRHLNVEPLLDTGTTVYVKSANSVVLDSSKLKTCR
jgi:hypothetical protein